MTVFLHKFRILLIELGMGLLYYYLPILIIIGTISWRTSSLAKRWIKFSLFMLLCLAVTFLIPLWLFRPRDSRNALFPSSGFRKLSRILGLRYTIEGTENIVRNSGSVVLMNHQSCLDLIVLSYLWPTLPKCTVIARKEVFYILPIGLAMWLCGVLFIDRAKPSEAQSAINKTGEVIRNSKARVLIFPEGTRNDRKTLLPFKQGGCRLAVASQCPIQPIAVSRYTFLGPNKFEEGEVKIRILPPIPTEGCTTNDVDRLTEEAYKVLSEEVRQLSDCGENNVINSNK